ncbi:MAG: extracellular solute-binding protein, partial [Pseudomonadota bacterium]
DETSATERPVINVYSARHYDSDRVLYDAFEASSGIRVRFREAGAPQLLETMKAEGSRSPADIIIGADVGAIWRFQEAGLTQGVHSDALTEAIPATLRDTNGHWFGLAKRARVIVFDPERLTPDQIDTYADLADPSLRNEVCVRSSSNIYNLSLLSETILRDGADAAAEWAQGVVSNFARTPQGGDTAQIESIAAGECAAGIVNHYYWVRLAQSESQQQRDIAAATALSFPNQDSTGAHINVTAAAVAANAPNPAGAVAFIEFLATPEGQALLVAETKEFPVLESVPLPDGLDALPAFLESNIQLSDLGAQQSEAQRIFTQAGWD